MSDIFCHLHGSTFIPTRNMKNLAQTVIKIAAALLAFLWVYAAVSKLLDFPLFKVQIARQPIPELVAMGIIWVLPAIEIFAAALLLTDKWRDAGFKISALMLTGFTIYIALILVNYFGRIPCACGGVIEALGWKMHLFFNLFFLLLAILGIYVTNRERRAWR